MPELPEVQTVVTTLAPKLIKRRINAVAHLRDDIVSPQSCNLRRCLKGRKIISLHRRAKRIVFGLDDGNFFYIHLGMTGRLTIDTPETEIAAHTHVILQLDNVRQLRFRDPRRFGGVFWLGSDAGDALIGPEPLTLGSKELAARLIRT
ncbi:MAG: DNA-formamidopyrimidine glycosylase, partial [Chthoniobacterales bacterium]|nr:DNA-formamidopyrimidine glycosylase [Chthoniobacterales bacterium]